MPTFCDRCGAPLVAGDQRCRTCGWPTPVRADESPYGAPTQRVVLPGDVATDARAAVPAEPAAGSPWERPVVAADPADAGWTPGPTESFAATAPPQRPAAGGGLDDPSAYGRWRLEPEPELAQWREEPPPGEAPVRRTFGVVDDDRPSVSRIAVRVFAILAAAAVVALVGLSVLFFGVLRGSGDPAPAAAGTRSATSTPKVVAPPPGPRATSSTPGKATTPTTPSPTTTAYPPVALSGKPCGGSGEGPWSQAAAGSSQTSCPFALAVQQAFLASSPAPNQPRTLAATSPVTGKAYPMACTGNQPVTCAGGNGALVYLYGGAAAFG